MTYYVSSATLNPTNSLTHCHSACPTSCDRSQPCNQIDAMGLRCLRILKEGRNVALPAHPHHLLQSAFNVAAWLILSTSTSTAYHRHPCHPPVVGEGSIRCLTEFVKSSLSPNIFHYWRGGRPKTHGDSASSDTTAFNPLKRSGIGLSLIHI